MPLFLSQRDTTSQEQMDDPDCDPDELRSTYRQFAAVNPLISRWRRVYKQKIRPLLQTGTPNMLLDIGFGGGDIPIQLARWAIDDNLDLTITAIDPDPRAFNFVQEIDRPQNVEFLQCNAADLDPSKQQYDFVISNHLLHHLNHQEFLDMLEQAETLSKKAIIFNDIHRSDWAYLLFSLLSRPIFRSSFITDDGLTSIKRSYTYSELTEITPDDWQVESMFPFRLLLTYHHE